MNEETTPTFESFNLKPGVLSALQKMGFKAPSPVQAQSIPLIQQGKDLIALAETGSGKTAACAIPVCDRVDTDRNVIQALIVVPTRELALQYAVEAQKVGKDCGVKTFAVFGGEDYTMQLSKLNHGVHVLVATPGRLIDFIYQREIDLSEVETLILDEADEMLSMGFYDDLEFIIQCLIHEHQTLLFSATMPKDIARIAKQHMKDPLEVTLQKKEASPTSIDHAFLYCAPPQKNDKLAWLVKENRPKQSIVFCRSRQQCEEVCRALKKSVRDVDFLHGGMNQDVRTVVTGKFRSGRVRHLVATDVAARGLDFSGVTHVFIYDIGRDVDQYVHRSGRTGRANRKGSVVTLVTKRDLPVLKGVLKRIQREPKWIGKPPEDTPQAKGRSKGGGRGGRSSGGGRGSREAEK